MTFNSSVAMQVRAVKETELQDLARIWQDGWLDAHARVLPPELVRYRTLESFRLRLHAALPSIRAVGVPDCAVGFCLVQGAELYQLYVAECGRGAGVGRVLLADAEARLSASGVGTAWLTCAIGNERAALFYERHGWKLVRTTISQLKTQDEPFPLRVWRFEKGLTQTLPAASSDGSR